MRRQKVKDDLLTKVLCDYKSQRAHYQKILRRARLMHNKNIIEDCAGDQKKVYAVFKSLMPQPRSCILTADGLEDDTCDTNVVSKICHVNNFFVQKIQHIYSTLNVSNDFISTDHSVFSSKVPLETWGSISKDEILKIMKVLPNKQCSGDIIPTWLFKKCWPAISLFIVDIINASFQTGQFPSRLAISYVTPVLKKHQKNDLQNYRPVASLPFLSKIIEKIVCKRLVHHVKVNLPIEYNLYQSAYKQHHSTETVLLHLKNDILHAFDEGKCMCLVQIDLSAAFDMVHHETLLQRLSTTLNLGHLPFQWLRSYLNNRKQKVVYDGMESSTVDIKQGVPQGSILGPFMFIHYMAPVLEIIKSFNLQCHAYADDIQIYGYFKRGVNQIGLFENIKCCMMKVSKWMLENHLKLNPSKTKMIVFCRPKDDAQYSINIDGYVIHSSDVITSLGVPLDKHLTMSKMVSKICQKGYFFIRSIAMWRRSFDVETCRLLVNSFVVSIFDYCNSLLYGISKKQINHLQKLQSRAAKVIYNNKNCKFNLKSLHWLPIHNRIKYKLLCFAYLHFAGTLPHYLHQLLEHYQPLRQLRSGSQMQLTIHQYRLKYGLDRFAIAAAKEWNLLPLNLKISSCYESFRRGVKTYLFKSC